MGIRTFIPENVRADAIMFIQHQYSELSPAEQREQAYQLALDSIQEAIASTTIEYVTCNSVINPF